MHAREVPAKSAGAFEDRVFADLVHEYAQAHEAWRDRRGWWAGVRHQR